MAGAIYSKRRLSHLILTSAFGTMRIPLCVVTRLISLIAKEGRVKVRILVLEARTCNKIVSNKLEMYHDERIYKKSILPIPMPPMAPIMLPMLPGIPIAPI